MFVILMSDNPRYALPNVPHVCAVYFLSLFSQNNLNVLFQCIVFKATSPMHYQLYTAIFQCCVRLMFFVQVEGFLNISLLCVDPSYHLFQYTV